MLSIFRAHRIAIALGCILSYPAVAHAQQTPFNVTTYHYDNFRSGWNASETTLTPANVNSASFGPLYTAVLDEQVDAQPLYVANLRVKRQGTAHNLVFAATENNTIYAIDADSGNILLKRNFGTPVPKATLPDQCYTNSVVVGISSTPVIDLATQSLYVITDTYEDGTPTLRLHRLRLYDLSDEVSPAPVISATGTLRNGRTVNFSAAVQHQRAALLFSRGNIYAGFASYCDASLANDFSRGWVLAWRAETLGRSGDRLLNQQAFAPTPMFETSVWMSGSGIAADPSGNVYFVTGNSDWAGGTYNRRYNLSESAISLDQTLATLRTFFTPHDVNALDKGDIDFGSGGIMLLPPQPGTGLNLATAMGKTGILYLLNRDDMGGYTPGGPDNVLDQKNPGGQCWCGESYFTGADGVNRIVSSAGSSLMTWKIFVRASGGLALTADQSATLDYNEGGGFNTSVSSDGTSNAIIWAVGRPQGNHKAIRLFAFDANSGAQLTEQTAGTWVHLGANANIVPVVANGKVYVASYKQLQIFGLGSAATNRAAALAADNATLLAATPPEQDSGHVTYGVVASVQDNQITLRTRTGQLVTVGVSPLTHSYARVTPGAVLQVRSRERAAGVFRATAILPATPEPGMWGADR